MTRISFVSVYPPLRGRLSEYAYSLIDELQKCPGINRLDIITEMVGHPNSERLNDKTTVYRIWESNKPFSLLRIPIKIMKLRPDIVHFNVHMAVFGQSRLANFTGLCLPFICRLLGFRTIVTLHNMIEKIEIKNTGYQDAFINRLGAFLVTKLISMTSAVTLTMQSHTDFFKQKYRCKNAKTIPHGTWKHDSWREDTFRSSGTILYMGHSGPYKDLMLLLDAVRILEKKRSDVRLIVAGTSHPNYPGFLEKYKSKTSPKNVRFIGYVPDDELQPIFEGADVVVLPYFTCTGTSGVAHLASSFGTPIVATDLPEFRELAREGCGLLITPHAAEALANRVDEIMSNPNLALKLKEQNQYFSHTRTWDKIASSFCELYDELLVR